MATKITIDQDVDAAGEPSSFAVIRCKGLPLVRFKAFVEAVEGARFDRARRANLAPLDKMPAILRRLREAEFPIEVEPALVRTLQKHTAQQWLDLKGAQERADKIDAQLKKLGLSLYPFQRTGTQWLSTRTGALLADQMGLGKTIQAITALPAAVPVFVVAPAVAKGVWLREIARWRPQLRVSVLKGRDSFRWPEPGEVLVTNYDILPEIHAKECPGTLPAEHCKGCATKINAMGIRVKAEGHKKACDEKQNLLEARPCPGCHKMLKMVRPDTVGIVDEAHALKSGKARRTLRFRAISETVRESAGRIWLLTATPLLNNPSELWNVYAAAGIAQEAFGTWKNFVSMFSGKALFFGGYEWGTPEAEVAERIRRVSLRRMRAEVLPDLPEKTWRELVVDVDRKALAECDKYLEEVGGIEQLIALIEKDGIKFETMSRVRSALATAKTPALMALIKDHEEQSEPAREQKAVEPSVLSTSPLIVFSAHRFPIDLLKKRPGWRVITGDTQPAERTEIEESFQRGELKGLGCTIKAGGVSITLTRGNQVIFVDREFTPALNSQAEDRCIVHGQRVHTTRGSLMIEDVVKGDRILTHKGRWATVNDVWSRQHRGLITEILYTRHHEPLVSTHDHRVLVRRKDGEKNVWVEAHSVLPGDFMVMPRMKFASRPLAELEVPRSVRLSRKQRNQFGTVQVNGRRKPLPERLVVDEDLLRIMGWYLAEGYASTMKGKGRFISFSLHSGHEGPIGKWIAAYFKRKFDINANLYRRTGQQSLEVRLYSADLAFLFRYYFGGKEGVAGHSHHIQIRSELLALLSEKQVRLVLEGYFSGDGHVRKQQQEWCSTSPTLAYQIALMCAGLGWSPSMRMTGPETRLVRGRTANSVYAWHGMITVNGTPSSASLAKVDGKYVYHPVREVTTRFAKKHKQEKVCDLTIDGDESFVVGLATVHNCLRIGQRNAVVITILVADHQLDVRLAELVSRKQRLITQSVDAARVVETPTREIDAEHEQAILAAQEEVRQGRVARRFAESPAEKWAYTHLFSLNVSLNDRSLVVRLCEEAETIGLSDAQWKLAIRVCKRYPEAGECPEEVAA